MRRRSFLVASGALVAAGAAAGLAWLLGRERRTPLAEATPETVSATPLPEAMIPPESVPLLLAVADAIVPRYGEHPAASEMDLLPNLERWVRGAPGRLERYQSSWSSFESEIRDHVPFADGRPDPEALTLLLEQWYEAYRRQSQRGAAANLFEQIRRDVLRVYYSSPAGWASLGYTGPVKRSHPMGEAHAHPPHARSLRRLTTHPS